jgi:FkbH-like protein
MSENTILIAATFTAEPIADVMGFWSRAFRWSAEIEFAPFNQVFQQLLDPSSSLRTNEKGINVVIVRLEDWLRSEEPGQLDQSRSTLSLDQLDANAADFVKALKAAADANCAPILVAICPPSEAIAKDPVLGPTFLRAEETVIAALDMMRGVYLIRGTEWQGAAENSLYLDAESDALGRIPYTSLGFAALGTTISRKIRALRSDPYKVVVLDCDQTLWKGVVGEDGVAGIQVDPARTMLQEFVAEQRRAGMLVCLCSRNEEDEVIKVFRERTDMSLRLDDFTSRRINWEPKSENLKSLAAELNLGLDSFVFIDDDPVMCAEVRANCPEVVTLQLPSNDDAIPEFLQHLWAFDRPKVTSEDRKRPELYEQNAQREKLRQASQSFEEFLAGLCLELKISEMSVEEAARVSQLTQRTNQFNFTSRRRSEEEIQNLTQSGLECLVVELSDRFGAYGLVGVMMFNLSDGALCVETLLLSCRALGRGVEHRMLAKLGEIALVRGCGRLDVPFSQTAKNQPALRFLEGLGARVTKKADGDSLFSIPSDLALKLEQRSYSDKEISRSERQANVAVDRSARWNDTAGSEIFGRICSDLNSPQRILEAIRVSKRIVTPRSKSEFGVTNPEEGRLKLIWQEILGIDDIGVDDSFFDLGGTSLLAVSLFADIERQFGRNLPLGTLFEASTIRQLARILRERSDSSRWTSLVAIQPEGTRPPLFCVHAAGGNVLFYRDLVKHLGPDQPVYGLQAKGLERRRLAHNRVEDMAAHYISEVRLVQPEGPYYLAGACFGGLVVYEMCQQLLAQGEGVALAALFNTSVPSSLKSLSGSDRLLAHASDVVNRAEHHVGSLLLLPPRQKITYLIGKSNKVWRLTLRQLRRLQASLKRATYGRMLKPVPAALAVTRNAIKEAEVHYKAEIYPDRITLFRASRQPRETKSDPTLGWGDLVLGGLEIHEVPGYHAAIVTEPRVQVTAKVLVDCLERANRAHEILSSRRPSLAAIATA